MDEEGNLGYYLYNEATGEEKLFSVVDEERLFARSEKERAEEEAWDNKVEGAYKKVGLAGAGVAATGATIAGLNAKKGLKGIRLSEKTRKAIAHNKLHLGQDQFKLKAAENAIEFAKKDPKFFELDKEVKNAEKIKKVIARRTKGLTNLKKHEGDIIKKYGGNIKRLAVGSNLAALGGTAALIGGIGYGATKLRKKYKKENKTRLDNATSIKFV